MIEVLYLKSLFYFPADLVIFQLTWSLYELRKLVSNERFLNVIINPQLL